MELINEKQRFPFAFACVLAALIIGGSYLITTFVSPAPAAANRMYWYMTRAAGFTAYGLLSVSVLLGLSTTSKLWDKLKVRKLMTQMHQYTALLVVPFLCFHIYGLHQDTTIPFPWGSVILPFTASYRPFSTGLGVLTMYGWILIVVSSYIRERISVQTWRKIHYISLPMFVGVTLHGILTGSDSNAGWAELVYLVPTALFVVLLITRMRSTSQVKERRKAE